MKFIDLIKVIPNIYGVMRFGQDYQVKLNEDVTLLFKQNMFGYNSYFVYSYGNISINELFSKKECGTIMKLFKLELERRRLKNDLDSVNNLINILNSLE